MNEQGNQILPTIVYVSISFYLVCHVHIYLKCCKNFYGLLEQVQNLQMPNRYPQIWTHYKSTYKQSAAAATIKPGMMGKMKVGTSTATTAAALFLRTEISHSSVYQSNTPSSSSTRFRVERKISLSILKDCLLDSSFSKSP